LDVENVPPTILTKNIHMVLEDQPYVVDYDSDDDPDDDDLGRVSWHLETDASWLSIDTVTGEMTGTPDNDDVGFFGVKVTVFDGNGGQDLTEFELEVENRPPSILTEDHLKVSEDDTYDVWYICDETGSGTVTWHLDTNADWLVMDTGTGHLHGDPSNDDVGSFWVSVSVHDGNGGWDWSNFTLDVVNAQPLIVTGDVLVAFEDQQYYVDYDSDDDHDSTMIWHMRSNAQWLSIDKENGVLTGTPRNTDVGSYWVRVFVYDGHGGWGSHNFYLDVVNTPPKILTDDVPTAVEGQDYEVDYMCDDDGQGAITWHLETDASWLSIDSTSGRLTGLPTNDDIGDYWVRVSVDDSNGGYDESQFTLKVENDNDRPIFTSKPVLDVVMGETYVYDANALDIDKGEVLTYSLETSPPGMSIDPATGWISWIPGQEDIGNHEVIVQVKDRQAKVRQGFVVSVRPGLSTDISYPVQGEKVSGRMVTHGTAMGPEGMRVEVNIDGTGWMEAEGDRHWAYSIDTTKLKNGEHTIKVRSSWKDYTSEETTDTFVVSNPGPKAVDPGSDIPIYQSIIASVCLISLIPCAVALSRTEVGKFGFFSVIAPLYSRIKKEEVLDNFVRGQLFGHISEKPGMCFSELKRKVKRANGTVTYHLRTLERDGLIKSYRHGIRKVFFPSSMKVPKGYFELTKSQRVIFKVIKANPGVSQRDISRNTGISKSMICRIVNDLRQKGIIEIKRTKKYQYYASEDIEGDGDEEEK
jgi:DNA-binding MarR family transcriptional regulator